MTAADIPVARQAPRPPLARRVTYRNLVYAVFAIFIFCGSISLIEPSPYDFTFVIILPMWFIGGFRLSRALVPIILLWIVYDVAGFIALMPHWTDADSVKFQFQSLYLIFTVIFFSIFFSDRTEERLTLCLKAYTAGAVFCSLIGVAGYFDIAGLHKYTTMDEGRLSATFKDANVLGSYLILSALHLTQGVVLGRWKRPLLSLGALFLIFVNIFLSFSRGSWGATAIALVLMAGMGFVTAATRRERRRVMTLTTLVLAAIAAIVLLALVIPETRTMLFERAELLHSYDVGEEGRFGNQLRSLPMLLELPNGFGPLRFRLVFGLEPHNSYIGSFADDGWAGGFAWLIIVGATTWVGFRLCFSPSPYRRLMQIYWPTLFALLLQGFQIDIDHWRQLFLCFGAVWGTEAARLKHLRANEGAAQPLARRDPSPEPARLDGNGAQAARRAALKAVR